MNARFLYQTEIGRSAAFVNMIKRLPLLLALAVAALSSNPAYAGSGDSSVFSGFVQARVVTPGRVVALRDLRFGQFLQPSTAGTLTIATNNAATAAAGMTDNIGIPQLAAGRGAGGFTLTGTANRSFIVTLPSSATITSGSASMSVTNFTANTLVGGLGRLDLNGSYVLNVGARLNVGGGQAVGQYSGTYNITVIFL
jgi:hypothetical protein